MRKEEIEEGGRGRSDEEAGKDLMDEDIEGIEGCIHVRRERKRWRRFRQGNRSQWSISLNSSLIDISIAGVWSYNHLLKQIFISMSIFFNLNDGQRQRDLKIKHGAWK